MKSMDINLFGLEQIVSIPGLEDYEKITIKRISDTGVTVNGPKCGNNIVISGRTPAILWVEKEKTLENNQEIKNMTTENVNNSVKSEVVEETVSNRAKRGSIKAKMAALQVPEGKFTVKQFAELNNIPVAYANKWASDNAKVVGFVEKMAGQRGRSASLFEV